MKTSPLKTEALYENEKVDTQGKSFSACRMVFSPHGGDDWVFGTTEDVQAYWDSLTCSFDFKWLLFDTESEMMEYLKGIEKTQEDKGFSTYYDVKNCRLGKEPTIGDGFQSFK